MLTILVQLIVSGLAQGAIYALIGLGFALYLRSMHLLNFSHGEMLTIGAFVGLVLATKVNLPYLVIFPLAIIITALLGLLIERIAYRSLWMTAVDDPFLVRTVFATIAMGILLTNVALEIGGPFETRFPAPLKQDILRVGSIVFNTQRLLVLGVGFALVILLQVFFQRSKAGLAMRAVMLDRETAQLMGIDVRRSIALTFALSSGLSAAAGVLIAPIIFWSFHMGSLIGIKAFASLTLGGLYSFPGAIVGGLLVGVLESLAGLYLSSSFRDAIVFGLLILMLLVRPQGLLGKSQERVG
jgi:branched-chain amino acid transport system permease protein